MSEGVEKYRIPLLDGTNFNNWKFRMETLLDEMDLLKYVETKHTEMVQILEADTAQVKTEKEARILNHAKLDRKSKLQIIQRIADSHLEYAKDKETAFDLWTSLCNTFERKGIASQLLIRKALLSMKFDAKNDTLANHFLNFDKLIRNLRSTGAKLEEIDIVCHLLLTMPPEYDNVVTAIETLASENLNAAFVKNRLSDEESKRNDLKKTVGDELPSSAAFATQPKHKSGPGNPKGPAARFPFKCNYCSKVGHKMAECRKRQNDLKTKNPQSANAATGVESESNPNSFCFSATTKSSGSGEVKWFLDSGATGHLISSNVSLINVKKLDVPIKIRVAKSGAFLHADKVGEIQFQSLVNGEQISITVKDVLAVPKLEHNLLSVRKLEANGFRITFEKGHGTITKGKYTVAVAERNNIGLYELNFRKSVSANLSTKSDDYELWHNRTGHLNFEDIKKLQSETSGMKIDFTGLTKNICPVCIEGKQTHQPHNQKRKRATRPLQLIHSDLFGPVSPTSHDKKRFVLTFIDDYSHFTASYAMESKSEVLRYFKLYEAMATAHFNTKVSRFRCDNGREYISKEIKDFFESIQFEFTIRHTPAQNGVAERMNRTIVEKARCMLLSSKLGKGFWSEAVQAAVYLINRSPTSALNGQIPAMLWYKQEINVKKFKVFGCIAFLKLPKQLVSGKFDSRTLKCYFIGYCPNGYKFWDPENHKIVFGRDATFIETKFSFDGIFTEQWVHNEKDQDHEKMNLEEERESETLKDNEDEDEYFSQSDDEETTKSKKSPDKQLPEKLAEPKIVEKPRRSTRVSVKPRYLENFAVLALHAETFVDDVPQTIEEIDAREDKTEWREAVNEEMSALVKNDTWELTTLPKGKRALNNKWVFKIKRNQDGTIERYKARLVIKGCAQKQGYDYEETYAPVARLTTLRTLLSIIIERNLVADHMDVKNAFLHGELEEDVYMKIPEGFQSKNESVCKLKKALYGLKQAPRAWNKTFDAFITELGFKRSEIDKCLYIWKEGDDYIFLLLYVDDKIITGNNMKRIKHVKEALKKKFDMKDLGELKTFLGIDIERSNGKVWLSQRTYLERMLKRFNMQDCNPAETPMDTTPIPDSEKLVDESKPYRELVGCLMYAMLTTRPDLTYAVNYYSRYQHDQTEARWKGLKRILRYIKGTLDMALCYEKGGEEYLSCYVDADFGSELDRKSTSGFVQKVFGNTVSWTTKRQTSVALSSTEAEYIALATATADLLWMKNLLADLGVTSEDPPKVFEDNQSCIHLLSRWEHKRLKHVDVKYNFVRDLHENRSFKIEYISSKEQVADIFTKPLPKLQFVKLRAKLGLVEAKE